MPQSTMKTTSDLCDFVHEIAYAIHLYHGHGHLTRLKSNRGIMTGRSAAIHTRRFADKC